MSGIFTNVDENESVSVNDFDFDLLKEVDKSFLFELSYSDKTQKNEKQIQITSKPNQKENNIKKISLKDMHNEHIIFTVVNDEKANNSTIAKIDSRLGFSNLWGYIRPFNSICTMFTQLYDILVLFFDDCTIKFIDYNTGFPIIQTLIYSSKVINFSKYKDNVVGILMENGDCVILQYNYPRQIKTLFSQNFPLLKQIDFMKVDIIVTQMLDSKEYTMILDCFYKSDELISPLKYSFEYKKEEKYIYNPSLNYWTLLFKPNQINEDIPQVFEIGIDIDNIYQLESKLADDIFFFRPEFFRNTAKHLSFSL